jgi:16S rRNA processing protein RimM
VLVGRFGAAVGLKGEIRLQSFTGDPFAIADYGALTDQSGARAFQIEKLRPGGQGILVARVAGVADRTAAEALTNIELYADRALMPAETEDEFYVADLIGLSAVTAAGERLGEIVDVVNYGAGDIVEVRPPHGGDTLLFPFTKAVVPEIDIAGRRVVIAPPAEVDGEPPAA